MTSGHAGDNAPACTLSCLVCECMFVGPNWSCRGVYVLTFFFSFTLWLLVANYKLLIPCNTVDFLPTSSATITLPLGIFNKLGEFLKEFIGFKEELPVL
jgi:hypothetical protein